MPPSGLSDIRLSDIRLSDIRLSDVKLSDGKRGERGRLGLFGVAGGKRIKPIVRRVRSESRSYGGGR